MSKTRHTPGPWKLEDHDDVIRVVADEKVVADCTPHHITRKESRQPSDSEADANARLIAASPCLLAALEESLAANAALMRAVAASGAAAAVLNALPPGEEERLAGFGVRARAAVAKATGEDAP